VVAGRPWLAPSRPFLAASHAGPLAIGPSEALQQLPLLSTSSLLGCAGHPRPCPSCRSPLLRRVVIGFRLALLRLRSVQQVCSSVEAQLTTGCTSPPPPLRQEGASASPTTRPKLASTSSPARTAVRADLTASFSDIYSRTSGSCAARTTACWHAARAQAHSRSACALWSLASPPAAEQRRSLRQGLRSTCSTPRRERRARGIAAARSAQRTDRCESRRRSGDALATASPARRLAHMAESRAYERLCQSL